MSKNKLSISARLFKPLLKPMIGSALDGNVPVAKQRSRFHLASLLLPPVWGVEHSLISLNSSIDTGEGGLVRRADCKAEYLLPKALKRKHQPPKRALLYLHGGAYVLGSAQGYRAMASRLAKDLDAAALVPDYRLAPEHPFPAALEDAVGAWVYLRTQGFAPEQIVLAGDSAGAGLCMALMLYLRDQGEALPAAAYLMSPFVDMSLSGAAITERVEREPLLTVSWLAYGAKAYVGEGDARGGDARGTYVSPVFADLNGLPPLLIQVGTEEVLYDDGRRLAERAEAAGIELVYQEWQGMWHVWPLFNAFLPEGKRALAEARTWLLQHLV